MSDIVYAYLYVNRLHKIVNENNKQGLFCFPAPTNFNLLIFTQSQRYSSKCKNNISRKIGNDQVKYAVNQVLAIGIFKTHLMTMPLWK